MLAYLAFPRAHWTKTWSNNPRERLIKEVKRLTDVIGIFPNTAAVVRRAGAVLAEQDEEWQAGRRYLSMESLKKIAEEVGLTETPALVAVRPAAPVQPMGTTARPITRLTERVPLVRSCLVPQDPRVCAVGLAARSCACAAFLPSSSFLGAEVKPCPAVSTRCSPGQRFSFTRFPTTGCVSTKPSAVGRHQLPTRIGA